MGKSREKPLPASPAGAAANHAKVVVTLVLCSPRERIAAASQGAGAPAIKRANPIKFVSGNGPGTSQLQPRHWEEGRAAAYGNRVSITRPHAAQYPNSPAAAGFLFDTDALRLSEPKYRRARAMDRRPELPTEYLEK